MTPKELYENARVFASYVVENFPLSQLKRSTYKIIIAESFEKGFLFAKSGKGSILKKEKEPDKK